MNNENSRRAFLKTIGLAAAAAVMAPVVKFRSVFAEEAKMVDLNDPLAKALGYVADAKTSKDRKDKKAQCSNCQFYQGDAKSKHGKCQLIPSGDVAVTGWCRSYSQKKKA